VALHDDFQKLLEALTPVDGVLGSTRIGLSQASTAAALLANGESSGESLLEELSRAATTLESLEAHHEQLAMRFALSSGMDGDTRVKSKPPAEVQGRGESHGRAKQRTAFDFSAFTRTRWEAERLKGLSMMADSKDSVDIGDASGSGIKVFMTDMPKPFLAEKPCIQVKGRHIMVNTAEKARKIYVEISVSGTHDRVGFIRGANLARFANLATERSDCQVSAKKGGDLGWISKGKLHPRLEEVAMATPSGACSPPFKVANNFHMFLCEERKG